jgi:hypothetical protein
MIEPIHLKYAFDAARRAIVSFASILKTKNLPSLRKLAHERNVTGLPTSGSKALKTVSNNLSSAKRSLILTDALINDQNL